MSEETEDDSDYKMVRKKADELGEHFDTCSIFCTRYEAGDDGGTVHINTGVGNYFARIGHVKDWIIKEDERTRIIQRHSDENEREG